MAYAIRALVWSGVLSRESARAVSEVCRDGFVLAIALVAFCMPFNVLTELGCVAAGLAYPAACSASLLLVRAAPTLSTTPVPPSDLDDDDNNNNNSNNGMGIVVSISRRDRQQLAEEVKWLKYWVVYAAAIHVGHELDSKGLFNLVLFGRHHLHLLLLVFLQLPYFRGAVRLHDWAKRRALRLLLLSATTAATPPAAAAPAAVPAAVAAAGGNDDADEGEYSPLDEALNEAAANAAAAAAASLSSSSSSSSSSASAMTTPATRRTTRRSNSSSKKGGSSKKGD
jgi:hypothetical protein